MMNEAVLRRGAMQTLIEKFGIVETERFISLVIKEPSNYTDWRRDMYDGISVEELSAKAMKLHDNK
jgi:hypothetical protein